MALFLGRLTPDTRSRDLEDLFAKYGRVTRLDIKRGNLIRLYFSNQTWNKASQTTKANDEVLNTIRRTITLYENKCNSNSTAISVPSLLA